MVVETDHWANVETPIACMYNTVPNVEEKKEKLGYSKLLQEAARQNWAFVVYIWRKIIKMEVKPERLHFCQALRWCLLPCGPHFWVARRGLCLNSVLGPFLLIFLGARFEKGGCSPPVTPITANVGIILYCLFPLILCVTCAFGSSFSPVAFLTVIKLGLCRWKKVAQVMHRDMESFIVMQLAVDIPGFSLGQQHRRSYLNQWKIQLLQGSLSNNSSLCVAHGCVLCQTVTVVPSVGFAGCRPGWCVSASEVSVWGGVMRIIILLKDPFFCSAKDGLGSPNRGSS